MWNPSGVDFFYISVGSEEDGSLNSLIFLSVIGAHGRDPFTLLLKPHCSRHAMAMR